MPEARPTSELWCEIGPKPGPRGVKKSARAEMQGSNGVCACDSDFSYIIPPLYGDETVFMSESAVKTFILKETEMGL